MVTGNYQVFYYYFKSTLRMFCQFQTTITEFNQSQIFAEENLADSWQKKTLGKNRSSEEFHDFDLFICISQYLS